MCRPLLENHVYVEALVEQRGGHDGLLRRVEPGVDPDEPTELTRRERADARPLQTGVERDVRTVALPVELPAVEGAFELPVGDAAEAERHAAMRATVQERGGAVLAAEEHDLLAGEDHPDGFVRQLGSGHHRRPEVGKRVEHRPPF